MPAEGTRVAKQVQSLPPPSPTTMFLMDTIRSITASEPFPSLQSEF